MVVAQTASEEAGMRAQSTAVGSILAEVSTADCTMVAYFAAAT